MSCSTCKGKCHFPTACHEPEQVRMFRPSYALRGPFRRSRRRDRRADLKRIGVAVLIGGFLIVSHFITR